MTETTRSSRFVYVVYGKAGGEPVDLAALGAGGLQIDGAAPRDELGFSVASVADLNGDARRDLVLGAPRSRPQETENAGSAFVLYAPPPAVPRVDLAALGDQGYRIDGTRGALLGWSVASIGDLNGDERPEVVVGAPFSSLGGIFAGQALVVWGKAVPARVDLAALGQDGIAVVGASEQVVGAAVAPAGDVNGDGRPDLAVGAQLDSPEQRADAGSTRAGATTRQSTTTSCSRCSTRSTRD